MASKEKKIAMLTLTGETLFGERWQTDLARALKLSDARRIRQWLSGDRVMPDNIIRQLLDLLTAQKSMIDAVLLDINSRS